MKPTLYIFAISHYCEKARWALDYLEIDYDLSYLPVGLHFSITKKLGAPRTTLPILKIGDTIIQGSANIIDWAEATTNSAHKLTPAAENTAELESCLSIEKRLDDVGGVHTRRLFYSEALVEHPATVRPVFTKDLAMPQRLLITAIWPIVRKKMISGMDLGYEQGLQSLPIIECELSWLDGLLADGRKFLVGDTLTRADITAASLFGPLTSPKEHPVFAHISLPPRLAVTAQSWRERPVMNWIHSIYRDFR